MNKRTNAESLVRESKNHKLLMSRPFSCPECIHILADNITLQVTVSPDIFLPALYRHCCVSPDIFLPALYRQCSVSPDIFLPALHIQCCVSPPKLCVQCSLWFHYSDMTFTIKCTPYCIPHGAIYLVWRTCSLHSFCREMGDHLKTVDQAFVCRYLELWFWKCRKWQLFSI
jgi:hypothetical protein